MPFWEEMLYGFVTTVPLWGRAGQSCGAATKNEILHIAVAASKRNIRAIFGFFIQVHSSSTVQRNLLSESKTLLGGKYRWTGVPASLDHARANPLLPATNMYVRTP